jgi:ubiquitin carboxyl-terminal hydrolase 22/27/51
MSLPHRRCEVSVAPTTRAEQAYTSNAQVFYDLYGTVNHIGTMQSGHYVTNVKVDNVWYHCNDAHVSKAGVGDGEKEVVANGGAYVLFYMRR